MIDPSVVKRHEQQCPEDGCETLCWGHTYAELQEALGFHLLVAHHKRHLLVV